MKSSPDSAKSELYAHLLNSIDEKYGNITLPEHERQFVTWTQYDGQAESLVAAREQELMKKYATTEGFEPVVIGWEIIQKAESGETATAFHG